MLSAPIWACGEPLAVAGRAYWGPTHHRHALPATVGRHPKVVTSRLLAGRSAGGVEALEDLQVALEAGDSVKPANYLGQFLYHAFSSRAMQFLKSSS